MNVGTLDYLREENEDYFVVNAEFEVELMVKRLIPSHDTMPLKVRIHPENTRLIRMVMAEFPLEIKTDRWETAVRQISECEILAKQVETLNYVEPDKTFFTGTLLPFQKQALDFIIKTNGNTLITDEMGLGKTYEALSFVATKPEAMPVVVVAPLVTLINWKREIEKLIVLGNARPDNQSRLFEIERREPIIKMIRSGKSAPLESADFYLINYELVSRRIKDLCAVNPKHIIYDEIHYLRNPFTERYKACNILAKQQSVLYRLGLSGTPIYNKGMEMFYICEIIKSGMLGDGNEFFRRYCHKWIDNQSTDEGKSALANLLRKSIMIRRRKMEVLDDLPDKVRMKQTIPINTELYEKELEKLYAKIEDAKAQLSISTTDDEKKEGLFELNKKIREMRVAERQIAGLAKAPHVVHYMNELLQEYDEEKFVIFCHHKSVHKTLYDGLFLYNPVQIIGGQSDKERQDAIDEFQNGTKSRVIICGLRAGSLGINLTSSAYVIFAELDWTPSIHRQAEDRLHRIGQKNKVFAHYLEGTGTFDEILSHVLLNKTVEINNVLGDKMDHLNNKEALEFLEKRFKISKSTKIASMLQVN